MRAGKKRYTLGLLLRSWFVRNFSKYDPCCNKQCAFGIRSPFYKDNKCLNRWNPVKCGECWRADRLKLRRPLREDCKW